MIGALVAVLTLFYVGKTAGWWYATMDFSYPSMDHWLLYRSPLCRVSEFALGVLVAALYTARRETPVTVRERSLAAIAVGIGVVWALRCFCSARSRQQRIRYCYSKSVGALRPASLH